MASTFYAGFAEGYRQMLGRNTNGRVMMTSEEANANEINSFFGAGQRKPLESGLFLSGLACSTINRSQIQPN